MRGARGALTRALFVAFALSATTVASATTLIRASLDTLVATNQQIVVGEVVDASSYWNAEGNFILTDVRIAVSEDLKGETRRGELTVTILGGTVGDLSTVIVGGVELIPGQSYVFFLNEDELPGAERVLTVRDHSQGVFDVVKARDGVRAISQATRHRMVPDALGFVDPPGGAEGLLLSSMTQSIRALVEREEER